LIELVGEEVSNSVALAASPSRLIGSWGNKNKAGNEYEIFNMGK
jgi:hypothetical protein